MNEVLRNLERDMKQYLPRMDKPNPPLTDTPDPCPPLHASVGGDLSPSASINATTPRDAVFYSVETAA